MDLEPTAQLEWAGETLSAAPELVALLNEIRGNIPTIEYALRELETNSRRFILKTSLYGPTHRKSAENSSERNDWRILSTLLNQHHPNDEEDGGKQLRPIEERAEVRSLHPFP